MATGSPDDRFSSSDVAGLLAGLTDPEQLVRVACMRALTRLPASDELSATLEAKRRLYSTADVQNPVYTPTGAAKHRLVELVDSSEEDDLALARDVIRQAADTARRLSREASADSAALRITELICEPAEVHIDHRRIDESELDAAGPEIASALITSLFVRIATPAYEMPGEARLWYAESVGELAARLGTSFRPDIAGLFSVYKVFLRRSTQFWVEWIDEQGGPAAAPPTWFPLYEFEFGTSRVIEWTISRAGHREFVRHLQQRLGSADPRDRWAAAQLIEFSLRYEKQRHAPRFGGGIGPEDISASGTETPAEPPALKFELDAPTNIVGVEIGTLGGERRRYTDLTFYEGDLYPGDDLATAARLGDEVPLVAGQPYTLEVAIRLNRTGIDPDQVAPRAVINPREDKEDLTVYVLVESQWPGIEIEEPFARITWPYDRDSDGALFRLQVRSGETSQGAIEVRLYDQSLDLLDIVTVSVTVVSSARAGRRIPGEPATRLLWPDKEPGIPHIDPNAPPRLLSIHVSPVAKGYRLKFLFRARTGDVITIPVVRSIREGDLDKLLRKTRDFWTQLVITNYSAKISVTQTNFTKYVSQLADIGVEAWSLLFGSRYGGQAGASERLGELLAAMEVSEGSHVQITYSDASSDFIFPWSILYTPTQDQRAVDPLRFWGARYQIEQVTAGSKRDALDDEPVNVLFALDPSFENSELQKELFAKYQSAGAGRLKITSSISDQASLFKELVRDPSAHLVYFYCHGYAASRPGVLRPDGVQMLKRQIEALPEDSPEREALDTLLTLTAKMDDESWIYVGGSEIRESKLKLQPFFEKKRPIVFLNMCQSADLVPSMSGGLVRVFLEHHAAAVVGTESPMTGIFANAFAEAVFDCLFDGDDIGTALWKARRRFLAPDVRNPLGLAYTLYGRATARLGTRSLVASKGRSDSDPGVDHHA